MLARTPHHRVVEGLRWARPCARPACIPHGRPRGVKALGVSYERRVGAAVVARLGPASVRSGQWFEFEDANGHGWCQVDVLARLGDLVAVLECKLADVAGAQGQLRELYLPVVALATRRPVVGVVVVRHLERGAQVPRVCTSLREALTCAAGAPSVLHWIGKGQI
jgi:hypothetical protein